MWDKILELILIGGLVVWRWVDKIHDVKQHRTVNCILEKTNEILDRLVEDNGKEIKG